MEAVPRLPMISFQLKVSPEPAPFEPKLKQYIRDFYNEDPESYSGEIHQLESLRAMAVRPPIAVTGCSLLKKYYCQLHFVQSRFLMGNDEPTAIPFSWKDTYSNTVFTISNIRFEIVSILYNIGAIHTQLGAKTERTSAEGMKMACSHFQCAAWAFENLQKNYPPGVDLSPELMKFMHQLCLSQAQECILEKSMLDNRKPTIVAKVAKQIVDYYSLAQKTLESTNNNDDNSISEIIGSKLYKTWKNYVNFKQSYHMAVTLLYQGLASEEQQKMGERVAFYNAALTSLKTSRSLHNNSKGSGGITGIPNEREAVEEALIFTNDVIEGKRKAATNENEFIYHEEVPEKDALPTVNGASLVKGISFNINDPEVSGPDIFARLVPMKVHEASSLYSEEKAKILRSVGGKIEEKDHTLEMFLSSLKLQHLSLWDIDMNIDTNNLLIPEELAERCAALNAKPNAIQELEDVMAKLSTTYGDVETMLKTISKLLTEEEQKEKQYQEAVGKRPPTIVATDLTRETKKYEEAHAKASESNQALHRAMSLHLNYLKILSQPLSQLEAHLPSLNDISKPENKIDQQNIRELKRILGKVEEMQIQRSELYSKLRESIAQDNLTRLLVTATAESTPLDALFSEQLEKHQSLVNLIDQNLAAQDNILSALTDAYAKTAGTRKSLEEAMKRRDLMISSLITAYDTYEDLMATSSKGLEFYRKLEVNVSKLLQRVKSTCRVQDEEREQILARNDSALATEVTSSNVIPKKTGSGMKLRDHLANRLKNNPAYQSLYEKQTVEPNNSKQFTDSHAITDNIQNPVKQYSDHQMYKYYNPYVVHQYPTFDGVNYSPNNKNLPTSGTTNSDIMYRQAGGAATQVSSNTNHYAGYNNYSQVDQTQYSIQNNYEEGLNYPGYSDYHANQMYQVPSTYPSVQEGVNYNQQYTTTSVPSVLYQTYDTNVYPTVSAASDSPNHYPKINQVPTPVPTPPPTQQYDATFQNRDTYNHQYQTNNIPRPTDSSNNYSVNQSESVLQTNQQHYYHQQVYSTPETSYGIPNSEIPPVNPTYTTPDQYLTNQISTSVAVSNETNPQVMYSATTNIPVTNSVDQQQYYQISNQSNSLHPTSTSYIIPPQQGYMMNQSAVQPTSQVQTNNNNNNNNNYGQNYSIDGNNYQVTQIPSTIPEIIQSHTKSNYHQNYQYSNPNSMIQPFPGYSWDQQSSGSSSIDSYKGHPGYSFDPSSGIYQYSSGYQNSQNINQAKPSPIITTQIAQGYDDTNFQYTNANNASNTSSTPSSQYLNGYQNTYNNQTYTQAQVNPSENVTTSTASENLNKSELNNNNNTSVKSNLDLLADLDITINHAPLVPEVPVIEKSTKEETDLNPIIPDKMLEVKKAESLSESLSTQIDDKLENLQIVWDTWYNDVQPKKDPLGDPTILQKFIRDIEKYEKFVDSLTVMTLSGSTNLDIKWKEVQEIEDREFKKQTYNVANAHSSENRTDDWIPYDSTRVRLSAAERSSDYINASHIKDLTQWTPTFIVAQAPISQTFEAFWSMIWEQGSEVIACLCTDLQLNGDIYWPVNKEINLIIGNFTLTLKSCVNHTTYIQRVIGMVHSKRKIERIVVHMQYLSWPSTGLPSSPGSFLSFATDIMSEQALRHCPKPIVIHCLVGGPISGLFLLAAATVCHVRAGNGVVDVPLVFSTLVKYRRCLISLDYLLFGYRMVLYHAQDVLMKRGILSSTRSTFDAFDNKKGNKGKCMKTNVCHPSDDFLHNLGVGMQHNLGRTQGKEQSVGPIQAKVTSDVEEKTDKSVDPLSQLDPLWSIRKETQTKNGDN